MTIDVYKRYQNNLKIDDLFPSMGELCACGCGATLEGKKKKWSSKECRTDSVRNYFIIKGDNEVIRNTLFKLDNGFCRCCGQYSENWQADHIKPVHKGGGACDITNFQTLCVECHKEKSVNDLNGIPDDAWIIKMNPLKKPSQIFH